MDAQGRTADGVAIPASLTIFGASTTDGAATVVRRTVGRRAARAALTLGVFWVLAAIAVFIPLGHFVLVPGLLLAGAIVAVRQARQPWTLRDVRGRCPRCLREQTFVPAGGSPGRWHADCPGCRNQVTVTATLPPASG